MKAKRPSLSLLAFAAFRILLCSWLAQTAESAPYVYIDATPSNTTLNGTALDDRNVAGGADNYFNHSTGTTGTATDGFWSFSTYAGFENDNFFQSDTVSTAGDAENTAPLITTITLATVGTYDIVAMFTRTSTRDIAAKIGSAPGAGDVFTISNAWNASQTLDPLQIDFDTSYTDARTQNGGAAFLGQITTTVPHQSVQIYINGLEGTAGTQDERTQYDGIGYRPQVATPRHRDVFLIAGQSNADGRGLKAELTGPLASYAGQQPGVLIHYNNTFYTQADQSRHKKWMTLEPGYSVPSGTEVLPSSTFGVEIGAAKVLSTQYDNPAFIKAARGGTALGVPGQDWYPAPLDSPDAGPLYKALIESTRQALAELTAAGDTYTVHAMFWHQGESDTGRTAQYVGLLTTLIESVRRDLAIPNLRFVVGELSPLKPQTFRTVQWQAARTLPNAGFISSRALTTSDAATHFDAPSMVTFGRRLGYALLPNRELLDFEFPLHAIGALDRQDECAATDGLASVLQVAATAAQGEYTGGQAAGHVGTGGSYFFTRRNLLPLAAARSMQADFFPGDTGYDNEADADSTLLVAGWGADAGNDGLFVDSESAIGLGLHQTGTFRIQIGNTIHLATGFNYLTDRWYRLTLNWSDPDAGGNRAVNLFARDLSTGTDLNGGSAILSISVSSTNFDGNPSRWSGLGCRSTRGLVDNIRVVPQGFAAWTGSLYPTLAGGLLDDDDQDGICNALEFAFGLNPLNPDPSTALPQPVFGPAAATVSFSPPATQPGIFYQVDWSRNLNSWTTVNGTRSGSLLQFTIPTADEPALFLRHRVEVNE